MGLRAINLWFLSLFFSALVCYVCSVSVCNWPRWCIILSDWGFFYTTGYLLFFHQILISNFNGLFRHKTIYRCSIPHFILRKAVKTSQTRVSVSNVILLLLYHNNVNVHNKQKKPIQQYLVSRNLVVWFHFTSILNIVLESLSEGFCHSCCRQLCVPWLVCVSIICFFLLWNYLMRGALFYWFL